MFITFEFAIFKFLCQQGCVNRKVDKNVNKDVNREANKTRKKVVNTGFYLDSINALHQVIEKIKSIGAKNKINALK